MRLIDADALKEMIEKEAKITDLIGGEIAALSRSIQECMNEELNRAPTAEAEFIRHGKWTQICDISHWQYTDEHYMCSECSETTAYKSNYCPRCGTRMDLENDDD